MWKKSIVKQFNIKHDKNEGYEYFCKALYANIEYSVVLIFVHTMIHFFSGIFDEQKLQKNSISEIFCKIINDFTVTFDTFNGSLLNKNITLFN